MAQSALDPLRTRSPGYNQRLIPAAARTEHWTSASIGLSGRNQHTLSHLR